MIIASYGIVLKYTRDHASTRKAADKWANLVRIAIWNGFEDVRKTFGTTVDRVDACYIFDIGKNYRLITSIDFDEQILQVKEMMTHDEYDRGRWKRHC